MHRPLLPLLLLSVQSMMMMLGGRRGHVTAPWLARMTQAAAVCALS
jgi:hypothetical protein